MYWINAVNVGGRVDDDDKKRWRIESQIKNYRNPTNEELLYLVGQTDLHNKNLYIGMIIHLPDVEVYGSTPYHFSFTFKDKKLAICRYGTAHDEHISPIVAKMANACIAENSEKATLQFLDKMWNMDYKE